MIWMFARHEPSFSSKKAEPALRIAPRANPALQRRLAADRRCVACILDGKRFHLQAPLVVRIDTLRRYDVTSQSRPLRFQSSTSVVDQPRHFDNRGRRADVFEHLAVHAGDLLPIG